MLQHRASCPLGKLCLGIFKKIISLGDLNMNVTREGNPVSLSLPMLSLQGCSICAVNFFFFL